jgi:hypothetical protein
MHFRRTTAAAKHGVPADSLDRGDFGSRTQLESVPVQRAAGTPGRSAYNETRTIEKVERDVVKQLIAVVAFHRQ